MRGFARKYLRLAAVTAAGVSGGMLLLLVVLITGDVVKRNVFGAPLAGAFELSRLMLLFSICLAWPLVALKDEHLKVDILIEQASDRIKRLSGRLDALMTVAVFVVILYFSSNEAIDAFLGEFRQPGMIQIPTWIFMAVIAVSAFAAALVSMAALLNPGLQREKNIE